MLTRRELLRTMMIAPVAAGFAPAVMSETKWISSKGTWLPITEILSTPAPTVQGAYLLGLLRQKDCTFTINYRPNESWL